MELDKEKRNEKVINKEKTANKEKTINICFNFYFDCLYSYGL